MWVMLRAKVIYNHVKMKQSQGDTDFVEVSLTTPRDNKERKLYLFKILVLGDPGVGKTSFIRRYISDTFSFDRRPTSGIDFNEYTFRWDENTDVKLHFWDVPGQQQMTDQTKLFFRDARGIIVVYDATRSASMTAARNWKRGADERCTIDNKSYQPPSILLANKIDVLVEKSEEYDDNTLQLVVKEEKFRAGFPISSYANYNIAQSVRKLVELLLAGLDSREDDPDILKMFEDPIPIDKKCNC
jgi:small GTP-binding protein